MALGIPVDIVKTQAFFDPRFGWRGQAKFLCCARHRPLRVSSFVTRITKRSDHESHHATPITTWQSFSFGSPPISCVSCIKSSCAPASLNPAVIKVVADSAAYASSVRVIADPRFDRVELKPRRFLRVLSIPRPSGENRTRRRRATRTWTNGRTCLRVRSLRPTSDKQKRPPGFGRPLCVCLG